LRNKGFQRGLLLAESTYYFRNPESIFDRMDENYNNPRYDEIDELLARTKFEVIQLGEPNKKYLLSIVSGKTPENIHYEDEDGIPFIGARCIRNERVELDIAPRIAKEIHETILKGSQIKRNDVLVTMAGTIGRCAVFESDEECNANQAVAILRVNTENVIPRFLAKYLNSRLGQLFFGKLQHIASQPNINLEEMLRIKVVLPKKLEQESILGSVSAIESQACHIEEEINGIKAKSNRIMFEELKISVPKEDAKTYFFKTGKAEQSSYFTIPFNNSIDRLSYHFYDPKIDLLRKLTELYSTTTLNGIVNKPIMRGEQPKYIEEGEIIAIKTVDLKDGYIDYDNCLRTSREYFEAVPNAHVKRGDVLISSTGYVSLGKVDVYDSDDPAMVDGHVSILRLKEGYDSYFIAYFLRSHLGKPQFEKWWTGSSGQIELQPTDLERFVVPDNTEKGIPLKRQREIADKITETHAYITQLQRQKKQLSLKANEEFAKLLGLVKP